MSKRSRTEQRMYEEWQALCKQIEQSTASTVNESPQRRDHRKRSLTQDFTSFSYHYFPHYVSCEFAYFQKRAVKELLKFSNSLHAWEWPREHAKSVIADVMVPLFLYARAELTGMVLASATQDKAMTLLSDLQAEFVSNQRWIADYGELAQLGDWREGAFATTDGIGFWAFGRGQSPRGVRKASLRPNLAVIDDIDDKVLVRNQKRVKDTVDWILEDVLGALNILGSRLLVAGNRIHKHSVLAHLVGDLEPGDPKREGIRHSLVYAIEDKRHRKSDPAAGGKPAWKERYENHHFEDRRATMGYRAYRREYFHEHHEEGLVFKNEHITWAMPFPKYDALIVYTDPSFKHAAHNDYKSTVLLGKKGKYIDVLYAWIKRAPVSAMVQVIYDLYEEHENAARYYIEANMLQDLLLDDFEEEGQARGYQMPIRADKRKKPDKELRIENLEPLMARGLLRFSEKQRKSADMQRLVQQFLGFPYDNDDGPDSVEGGVSKLQKIGRASRVGVRTGKYKTSSRR